MQELCAILSTLDFIKSLQLFLELAHMWARELSSAKIVTVSSIFPKNQNPKKGLLLTFHEHKMTTRANGPFGRLDPKRLGTRNFSKEHILWVINKVKGQRIGWKDTLGEYGVSEKTFYRWKNKIEKGTELHQTPGRNPKLDIVAVKALQDRVLDLQRQSLTPPNHQFQEIVLELANETSERRNEAPLVTSISTTTLKRVKQQAKTKSKTANNGTAATKREMSDPRNFFVTALIHNKFGVHILPGRHSNMDASLYCCGQDGAIVKVNAVDDPQNAGVELQRADRPEDTHGIYVKVINIIANLGHLADPVFVVALEDLDSDECLWLTLPGWGTSTSPSSCLHIALVKSRASMGGIYEHLLEHIIDFLKELRKYTQSDEDEDADNPGKMVFTFDGEYQQLVECCRINARKLFDEQNCITIKGGASLTPLSNALDAGGLQKGTKKASRHASPESYMDKERAEALEKKLSSFLESKGKKVTPLWLNQVSAAVLRLKYAYGKVVTQELIINSFRASADLPPQGMHVGAWAGLGVLKSKMAKCLKYPKLTTEEYQTFVDAWDEGMRRIAKGYLTEQEMTTDLKIPVFEHLQFPDHRKDDRDKRPLANQRARVLGGEADIDSSAITAWAEDGFRLAQLRAKIKGQEADVNRKLKTILAADIPEYLAENRVAAFKLNTLYAIAASEITMDKDVQEFEKQLSPEGELLEMEDRKSFLNAVAKAMTKFKDALDKHLLSYKKKTKLEGPLGEEEQEFLDKEKTDWVHKVDENFSKFRTLLPSPAAASTTQRATSAKNAKTAAKSTTKNAAKSAKNAASKKRRSATPSTGNPYTKEFSNKRRRIESTQAVASNVL